MTKKLTKKNWIIMAIYAGIAAALMIAFILVDSLLVWRYATNIDRFLGVTKDDFSNASEELIAGDRLVTEIQRDSIVMFKNENNALPIAAGSKINVFGYGSSDEGFLLRGIGSGSSTISGQKAITFMEALEGKVRDYDRVNLAEPDKYGKYDDDGEFTVTDRAGLDADLAAWASENLVKYEVNPEIKELYAGHSRPSNYGLWEPTINTDFRNKVAAAADFSQTALFVLTRNGGENIGEIPADYLELSSAEKSALQLVRDTFDKVIVILNTANTMHLGFLEEMNIDACIYVGLTGQSGARAIPEVLSGKVNPSGKFTDIVTKSNAVVQKFDPTWANREPGANGITYADDIYYGYKWYETAAHDGFTRGSDVFNYDDVVAYPFGHGIGYTTFKQEISSVSATSLDNLDANAEITVKVKVTNTGAVAGKDVVQLYYTPDYTSGGIEKAHVNLLDFGKTALLQPGTSETVTLTFTPYDMASYDAYDKNQNDFWGYELESGKYELKLMKNSHEVIESRDLTLSKGKTIDVDPVTQAEIANRFTGKDSSWNDSYNGASYAGLGSDGYEAGIKRDMWFTRADFAKTFPSSQGRGASGSVVNKANKYYNNEYAERLPKVYEVEQDAQLYLVEYAQLDEEKQPIEGTNVKATLNQLNGSDIEEGYGLVYNWDLMKELAEDYDGPIWDEFLNQMKVSEMKDLIELGGFHRVALESVGKNREYDYDGPAGYNTNSLTGNWGGDQPDTNGWTAYESEALIGCCWNETLMLTMGMQQGAEASVTNVNGWYAPGVNLHRTPYTARNYEYYSEDGVLSGKLAAYVILGAKVNGLNCYLKHFVCSEEGPNAGGVNTWITEQNLRENYLRPFEIAVKEGHANSMMSAFNNVGSTWAGANYALLVQVLRDEWGFRGAVITDWTNGGGEGGMYTRQGVRAGNDLWLNPQVGSINNPLDSSKDEVFMRNSAHNLLYVTADTLNTYNQCSIDTEYRQELLGAENEELYAQYRADLGVSFLAEGYSWWKPALIAVEVIVCIALVVGGLFHSRLAQTVIGMVIKKPQPQGAAEGGSSEAVPAEETAQEQAPEQAEQVPQTEAVTPEAKEETLESKEESKEEPAEVKDAEVPQEEKKKPSGKKKTDK